MFNSSYQSIVGMLIYLSSNTCPDNAFAVSQVAQFTKDPKALLHVTTLKFIIHYIKYECKKILIFILV